MAEISTRTIESSGLSIALRSAGRDDRPAFVLLHGWPQCARAFDSILQILGEESYLIAPDLPGIGDSRGAPASGEKTAIAPHIEHIIAATGARDVILVGHDVGGMVAFACFKSFGARLTGGAILNTVIPGIDPWERVLSDPRIWHFAFHAIPGLPETLVRGARAGVFRLFLRRADARSRTNFGCRARHLHLGLRATRGFDGRVRLVPGYEG